MTDSAINFDKNLTEFEIPAETLKTLNKQSIYTVGELLRTVNKANPTATKIEIIKIIREITGLGLKQAKEITDCGFPPAEWKQKTTAEAGLSTDKLYQIKETINKEAIREGIIRKDVELKKEETPEIPPKTPPKETVENPTTDFYLTLPEVLTELGKGIGKAQRELDMHSIEVQNSILKDKELADYGINATWYVMPEIQFDLKMEYSVTEKRTEEGEVTSSVKKTARNIEIIPSNMKYNTLFESERREESTLSIKFRPMPPPQFTIIRTEVPNLYGMTKNEAEAVLKEAEIEAEFISDAEPDAKDSETNVVFQTVNPGDFLLNDEKLTVYIEPRYD